MPFVFPYPRLLGEGLSEALMGQGHALRGTFEVHSERTGKNNGEIALIVTRRWPEISGTIEEWGAATGILARSLSQFQISVSFKLNPRAQHAVLVLTPRPQPAAMIPA